MKIYLSLTGLFLLLSCPLAAEDLMQQRAELMNLLKQTYNLSPEQTSKISAIIDASSVMGQGNPAVTKHPMTTEECTASIKKKNISYENAEFEKICGSKYMAPLYDPKISKPESAKACIDQFEFPGSPCSFPVVWVKANEAAQICEAMGKRLCDAHEWEGACAGQLKDPDYDFAGAKGLSPNAAVERLRQKHNAKESASKSWAYGANSYQKGKCAANSFKHDGCNGGDWKRCGSNTYPTGSFPECKSALEVYDQHGNAAEHMNLPLTSDQMSSAGSKSLGYTEMKGSWFIWDKFNAHQDWCRWRAPYWHGSKVMDSASHHNYHLGFRCCKTIP
jgi:hypothetical protein